MLKFFAAESIGKAPVDYQTIIWIVLASIVGAALLAVTVFMVVRVIREKHADKLAEREVIDEHNAEVDKRNAERERQKGRPIPPLAGGTLPTEGNENGAEKAEVVLEAPVKTTKK